MYCTTTPSLVVIAATKKPATSEAFAPTTVSSGNHEKKYS